MTAYTVNVQLNMEQTSRLNFLARERKSKARTVAYDLLATGLAEAVIGDPIMRARYDEWQAGAGKEPYGRPISEAVEDELGKGADA